MIEAHPLGLTWVMDDPVVRTSHALADDGRVWLIDPVDEPEALERAAALGTPVAVLQLFVAHPRDGAAIAARLGVPLKVLPDAVPPFEVIDLSLGPWKERALWWPQRRGLIVPEAVGTAEHYAVGPGPAGVHMLRRALPPGRLRDFAPEHLLVGHGAPLHGESAAAGLHDALARSRRDIPTLVWKLPSIMRGMRTRR
ncbi:MAG TPA: hypothetical protein VNS09_16235 [Solirubrobacter sp.]|nr:hypothetical protein [Solirubrobacter sp.]